MTKQSNHKDFSPIFNKMALFCVLLVLQIFVSSPVMAKGNCPDQGPRLSAQEYCKLYAAEAQRQMKLYGIPASITLAQGMYESAYGASYIAVKANNHFGIKAYRGWSGPVVRCDDDRSNEPFCKFKTVQEGYEHHSHFLKDNTRYAPLFKLKATDYEGWAKGLQKCGYATNPKYPQQLVDIIRRYNLDAYDVITTKTSTGASKKTPIVVQSSTHKLYSTARRRGLKYVKALKKDNLEAIGKEFDVSPRKLRTWNDLPKNFTLREGDIIYLQAKRSKADKLHPVHKVVAGETLHSISQQYGVTVHSIVKRNKLTSGTIRKGQVLKLR